VATNHIDCCPLFLIICKFTGWGYLNISDLLLVIQLNPKNINSLQFLYRVGLTRSTKPYFTTFENTIIVSDGGTLRTRIFSCAPIGENLFEKIVIHYGQENNEVIKLDDGNEVSVSDILERIQKVAVANKPDIFIASTGPIDFTKHKKDFIISLHVGIADQNILQSFLSEKDPNVDFTRDVSCNIMKALDEKIRYRDFNQVLINPLLLDENDPRKMIIQEYSIAYLELGTSNTEEGIDNLKVLYEEPTIIVNIISEHLQ